MPSMEVDVQKLKELRRHKVLSMRELEALSGVSYNTIWRLETERTIEARPRSIRALAGALGVEPHQLLKGGEEDA
jgi:transcriptional regulator with XRE-family HTH domain